MAFTTKDKVTNWNGKIALKIEMYAREIFNFDDLNKDIKFFYNSDTAEVQPYEQFKHMRNKLFKGKLNDGSIEFISTYSNFDSKSLKDIGENDSFKMLEDFEKIYFNLGGTTL